MNNSISYLLLFLVRLTLNALGFLDLGERRILSGHGLRAEVHQKIHLYVFLGDFDTVFHQSKGNFARILLLNSLSFDKKTYFFTRSCICGAHIVRNDGLAFDRLLGVGLVSLVSFAADWFANLKDYSRPKLVGSQS